MSRECTPLDGNEVPLKNNKGLSSCLLSLTGQYSLQENIQTVLFQFCF